MTITNDDQLIISDALADVERASLLLEPIRNRQPRPQGLTLHDRAALEAAHDILARLGERLEDQQFTWRHDEYTTPAAPA